MARIDNLEIFHVLGLPGRISSLYNIPPIFLVSVLFGKRKPSGSGDSKPPDFNTPNLTKPSDSFNPSSSPPSPSSSNISNLSSLNCLSSSFLQSLISLNLSNPSSLSSLNIQASNTQTQILTKLQETLKRFNNHTPLLAFFNEQNNCCFFFSQNNGGNKLSIYQIDNKSAKAINNYNIEHKGGDAYEVKFRDHQGNLQTINRTESGVSVNNKILHGITLNVKPLLEAFILAESRGEYTHFNFDRSSPDYNPRGYTVFDENGRVVNNVENNAQVEDDYNTIVTISEPSKTQVAKMFHDLYKVIERKNKKINAIEKIIQYGSFKRGFLGLFLPLERYVDPIAKKARLRAKFNKKLHEAWARITRKLTIEDKMQGFKENLFPYFDTHFKKLNDYQYVSWLAFSKKSWWERNSLQHEADDLGKDLMKTYKDWASVKEIEALVLYDIGRTKPTAKNKVRAHVFGNQNQTNEDHEYFVKEYTDLILKGLHERARGTYEHKQNEIERFVNIARRPVKKRLEIDVEFADGAITRSIKGNPCNKLPKGTRSIYRVNVKPDAALIYEMDNFIVKHGGSYSMPSTLDTWNKQHTTLVYHPDYEISKEAELELAEITRKHARTSDGREVSKGEVITSGNPPGEPVSDKGGQVINFLCTVDKAPTRIQLLELMRRAYELDDTLGDAVFDLFTREIRVKEITAVPEITINPHAKLGTNNLMRVEMETTYRELNDEVFPDLYLAIESTIEAIERGIRVVSATNMLENDFSETIPMLETDYEFDSLGENDISNRSRPEYIKAPDPKTRTSEDIESFFKEANEKYVPYYKSKLDIDPDLPLELIYDPKIKTLAECREDGKIAFQSPEALTPLVVSHEFSHLRDKLSATILRLKAPEILKEELTDELVSLIGSARGRYFVSGGKIIPLVCPNIPQASVKKIKDLMKEILQSSTLSRDDDGFLINRFNANLKLSEFWENLSSEEKVTFSNNNVTFNMLKDYFEYEFARFEVISKSLTYKPNGINITDEINKKCSDILAASKVPISKLRLLARRTISYDFERYDLQFSNDVPETIPFYLIRTEEIKARCYMLSDELSHIKDAEKFKKLLQSRPDKTKDFFEQPKEFQNKVKNTEGGDWFILVQGRLKYNTNLLRAKIILDRFLLTGDFSLISELKKAVQNTVKFKEYCRYGNSEPLTEEVKALDILKDYLNKLEASMRD